MGAGTDGTGTNSVDGLRDDGTYAFAVVLDGRRMLLAGPAQVNPTDPVPDLTVPGDNTRGRFYVEAFARIYDLDSRLNLNAVGNLAGLGGSHASNQGYGPSEINLSMVLGADLARAVIRRRNGPNNVPGDPGVDDEANQGTLAPAAMKT